MNNNTDEMTIHEFIAYTYDIPVTNYNPQHKASEWEDYKMIEHALTSSDEDTLPF